MGGDCLQRPLVPGTTLRARSVALQAPSLYLALAPRDAASWPIRVRFDLILLKVSQNRTVSSEYVEKASHSPYLQNESKIHLLKF